MSQRRKLTKQAKELLHAAGKVYHYRKDLLSADNLQQLETHVSELQALTKDRQSNDTELERSLHALDALLRRIGGKIYPKTFWSDNLEVILVAAIIVIGIRTFFFQPFIIPTNSMYPTYSGMNSVTYPLEEGAAPSTPGKLFRLLTLGARHFELTAERAGVVEIPGGFNPKGQFMPWRVEVPARKFFVLPSKKYQYVVLVDGQPHTLNVPLSFELQKVVQELYPDGTIQTRNFNGRQMNVLNTGVTVAAGDPLLRFDVTLGDALFVDRMSYHFKRPKVGDPFVFRTDEILNETPKYYIKRIAGKGGETLEVEDYQLFVDGQPRDEVEAFGRNAIQEGEYSGYIADGMLSTGRSMSVPDKNFVALGDNSANSLDSRYWGFVPQESVIGKAIFIYYPFTKRWGVAE